MFSGYGFEWDLGEGYSQRWKQSNRKDQSGAWLACQESLQGRKE